VRRLVAALVCGGLTARILSKKEGTKCRGRDKSRPSKALTSQRTPKELSFGLHQDFLKFVVEENGLLNKQL